MNERIWAILIRLFPSAFRERFGQELLATARELDRDNRRRGLGQLVRVIGDAMSTALRLRSDLLSERRAALRASLHGHDQPPQSASDSATMDSFLRDIRFALRGLSREKGFTAFVVATLALGIGANAAMFGIADRLLIRGPEHVRDAHRVARMYLTVEPSGMQRFTGPWFGHVTYDLLSKNSRSFTDVAAYAVYDEIVGRGDAASIQRIGYGSESLFPLLGVQPQLGRFFDRAENAEGAAQRVAVLGYGTWMEKYGGAPDVVGKSISINDEQFTIVGVAPRGFTGPVLRTVDVWLPINLVGPAVHRSWQSTWNAQWLFVLGRLADGVSMDDAGREATALLRNAYTGDDEATRAGTMSAASLTANESGVMPVEARVLQWLTGVSLLVLLIACANVANLLLARGMRRGREFAIRAALGAGRRRLVNLLLIESLMLSLCGAAAGLVIAWFIGDIARTTLFDSVEWSSSPVNARVIAASTLLAALTGLFIGLVPAVRASRTDLTGALRAGVRDGHGRRSRLRSSLTVAQAALSVLLLVGAGLFVRSLWNVRTLDLGVDTRTTLVVSVAHPPLSRIPAGEVREAERTRRGSFYALAAERIAALPGVERSAVAVGMPFGNRFTVRTRVPGLDSMPRLSTGGPSISAVSSDYFATVGTGIVRGRSFTEADRMGSEPVAIVSEQMAQTVWPGEDAIGKCLLVGSGDPPPCHQVVGIARNTHRASLREAPTMHYYIPYGQERGMGGSVLLVRGGRSTQQAISDLRRTLLELDPTINFVKLESLQEIVDPLMRPWRIGAIVFVLLGILALIVAAIGVYSVMSYLIADRRHEIGVRLALGAITGDIVRLIMRGSFTIAVAGVLLGEALALMLGRFAEPLLFNTSPRDPLVFGLVGVTLVVVALGATVLPALSARRVNPIEALRVE